MSHQIRKIGCVNCARFPKSGHILLRTPPSETEQMDFLSAISKHKPAINSIIHPFSDLRKPNAAIRELPPSLNNLYEPQHEELSMGK